MKKYTQPIFDDIKDPYRKELLGGLGDMYAIFEDIMKMRYKRIVSQRKLAQLSGIAQPTLAKIEAGRANPTLSVMVKIARALKCKLVLTPED